MADDYTTLNPGSGGSNIDEEGVTYGSAPVLRKRSRVRIGGALATDLADVDATTAHLKAGDFRDRSVVSTANSRTTIVAPGGTFTGTGEDIRLYDNLTVNLAGAPRTAHGTLFFEFSPDNTNWDVSVPLIVSDLSVVIPFPLRAVLPFFRVRYTNGTTVQTAFRLTTLLHRDYPGPLLRSPTQVIGPEEPVQVVRAMIEPGLGLGQRRILGADREVYGAAITHSRINQLQADFSQALANNDVTSTLTGTGATAQATGQATLSTGVGVLGASARLQTNKTTKYRPFREVYAAFTARFTAPGATAGEHQRAGLFDDNNGFFLGYESSGGPTTYVFGFTVRSGGVDTFTPLTTADGDPLDGSFLSRFSRNGVLEALDPTKLNFWRIRFGWDSSVAHFEIQSPDGEWMTIETIQQPNSVTTPSIQSPNLPMRFEVIKAAVDATNLVIGTGSWAAGSVEDPYGLEPYDLKSREEKHPTFNVAGSALALSQVLYTVTTGRRFRLTDLHVSVNKQNASIGEWTLSDGNGGTVLARGMMPGNNLWADTDRAFRSPPGFITSVWLNTAIIGATGAIDVEMHGYEEPVGG